MSKIKISHEVPLCLLDESLNFNDYDYCLPHLLDKSEEYLTYFIEAKKNGRYIVMDNSVHELGKPLDTDKLLEWIYKLEPNEFIVPDYFFDKTRSIVEAKYWSKINLPENTIKVAVVQAKNFTEAVECYQTYKDLGYKKIAFSYSAEYYSELVPHPNKNLAKALGRIKVISDLFNLEIINKTDRIHLLGCCIPQEFAWYKDFPFIESLDTSNPIMATIDNMEYQSTGLYNKPKSKIDEVLNIDINNISLSTLIHNIEMFRAINGFKTKNWW
jgi:hypothetical protein